ncbi:hypothetical protein [Streptomyces sp. NPDC058045]|uniref:hypothetical protein n=1 Tax=Streptomyces sp. NPDC058045 TaxID=3346311 RepID=UPI0036E8C6AA
MYKPVISDLDIAIHRAIDTRSKNLARARQRVYEGQAEVAEALAQYAAAHGRLNEAITDLNRAIHAPILFPGVGESGFPD